MPIDLSKNIRQRCHVNTNEDGDSFVGVKADTEDAVIYFPIGYQLPDNDDNLRVDIQNLFGVLATFMKEDRVIEGRFLLCRSSRVTTLRLRNLYMSLHRNSRQRTMTMNKNSFEPCELCLNT